MLQDGTKRTSLFDISKNVATKIVFDLVSFIASYNYGSEPVASRTPPLMLLPMPSALCLASPRSSSDLPRCPLMQTREVERRMTFTLNQLLWYWQTFPPHLSKLWVICIATCHLQLVAVSCCSPAGQPPFSFHRPPLLAKRIL